MAYSKSSNATINTGTWSSSNRVENAMNGLAGIKFDGTNSLVTTDPSGTYSSGFTLFVVFMPTASNTYKTLLTRTSTAAIPTPFDIYNYSRVLGNGTTYAGMYSGTDLNTLTLNKVYLFAYRVEYVSSESTAYMTEWLDGDLQYYKMKFTSYGDTGAKVYIGCRADGVTTFTGYMGEIVMYKTGLSDSNVSSVMSYLANKWTITTSSFLSYANTITARYLSFRRADGVAEYINLIDIQVFNASGVQINVQSGTISAQYSTYAVANVYDNNPSTFAITTNTSDAYITVDLGAEYTIGKVIVINRHSGITRAVGCVLDFLNTNSMIIYGSPKITASQESYDFTFENKNKLVISYYGINGTENVTLATNEETLGTETLTKTAKETTYLFDNNITYLTLTYNNDATGLDVYVSKLTYNGKNLLSLYTDTSTTKQTSVRAGTLVWGGAYKFST